jgi:protocatechuate 3,4-dioxygenase beta subunit
MKNRHTAHSDHDGGLVHDVQTLLTQERRRDTLKWLASIGVMGAVPLVGCGGGGDNAGTSSFGTASTGSTSSSTSSSTSGTGTCSVIPEETAGPYPGDGSNTSSGSVANALALSGIVRSDIRSSVGSATGTATGVPLTVVFTLENVNNACAPLDGYAIYLWHCDAQGRYSMYSSGVTNENYLRGVQATDGNGQATFVTIYPGCYSGRMPHMHFEVYRSLTTATSFSNKLKTSQLAFPVDESETVYSNTSAYSASVSNLSNISFATDNIFSDGYSLELVSITGDLSSGYVATISVGVSV